MLKIQDCPHRLGMNPLSVLLYGSVLPVNTLNIHWAFIVICYSKAVAQRFLRLTLIILSLIYENTMQYNLQTQVTE